MSTVNEKHQKVKDDFESISRELKLEKFNETMAQKEIVQMQAKMEEYQHAISKMQTELLEAKANYVKIQKNRRALEKSHQKAQQKLQSYERKISGKVSSKIVREKSKSQPIIPEDSFFNIMLFRKSAIHLVARQN